MREPHSNNSIGRAGGGSQWQREAEREGRAEVVVAAAAAVRGEREEEGGMREDAVRRQGPRESRVEECGVASKNSPKASLVNPLRCGVHPLEEEVEEEEQVG